MVLTGARQVGKSTLLRHEEPTKRWKYVTLDNLNALRQGERDPAALWAGSDRVVLDEVQRLPGILPAVKQAVDERPRKMRFILFPAPPIFFSCGRYPKALPALCGWEPR